MGATNFPARKNPRQESHSNNTSFAVNLPQRSSTEARDELLRHLLPVPPSFTLITSTSCTECVSHHLLFEDTARHPSVQNLRPLSITLHPSPSSSPPNDIRLTLEQETEKGTQLFFLSFANAVLVHALTSSSWLSPPKKGKRVRPRTSFVIGILPNDEYSSPSIDSWLFPMRNPERDPAASSPGDFLLPGESAAVMLYGAVCGMAATMIGNDVKTVSEMHLFVVPKKVLTVLHRFAQAASNILSGGEHLQQLLDEGEQQVEDDIYTLRRHALANNLPCGCVMFPHASNPSKSVPKCVPPPAIHVRVLRAMQLGSKEVEQWWRTHGNICEVNYLRQSYLHHLRGADLNVSIRAHLSYLQLFHAHRPSNALYALHDQLNQTPTRDWELKEAFEWLAKAFRGSEGRAKERMCSDDNEKQHEVFERELAYQVFGRLALFRTRNEVVRKFVSRLETIAGPTRRDTKGVVEEF
ncbi:unnamed protein product [Agarophyton chilense]|eukprot:gb/GEZJ01002406.1/.p1 GENE.gb/GEZJ01002406.1/~~gb/GEZJ01002406.1/.p1  ORF type:complete len:467 (+),score=52.88 gb/GEZJ01002406.1/:1741-3141(+)